MGALVCIEFNNLRYIEAHEQVTRHFQIMDEVRA